MPDISMCANGGCPLRHECYRFMAKPNEYRQTYAQFAPNPDGETCDYFWGVQDHHVVTRSPPPNCS